MNQSIERWKLLPFSQQILNIAADLLRAGKREDSAEIEASYESALALLDRTIAVATKFNTRWELCRLRELLAAAYSRLPKFDSAENEKLLRVLFAFTPESARQIE
ncbi:MAG: hypothetical protein ABIE14_03630 [Patescibacteria group bacterium]